MRPFSMVNRVPSPFPVRPARGALRLRLRRIAALLVAIAVPASAHAFGFSPEAGRIYIQNFTARDFGGHSQVFDTAHSPDGIVYAANRGAVLSYDGERWNRATVPTTWIRGLVWAPDNRVYLAGTDEIGWCATDSDGVFRYHSLLGQLPEDQRNTGPAWSVEVFDGAVFFATSTHVYRWQHGRLQATAMPSAPRAVLQAIAGRLFLQRMGDALYEWHQDRFEAVSHAPELTGSLRFALFERAPGRLIAAVADGSFYDYRDGTVTRWPYPAAAWLHAAGFMTGTPLRGGTFAVSTAKRGVALLSATGELLRVFDATAGLDTPAVYHPREDREGNLWIGHFAGLSRIERHAGYTLFDRSNGKPAGDLADVVRHRGQLYTYSLDALFRIVPASPGTGLPARLERVDLPIREFWAVMPDPHGLLIGSVDGAYLCEDGKLTTIAKFPDGALAFDISPSDPAVLYIGRNSTVNVCRLTGGTWHDEGAIPGIDAEVRSLHETAPDTLWLGTTTRGFIKVTRPAGAPDWHDARVDGYESVRGLPANQGWSYVLSAPDGAVFATERGVYRYDPTADRFAPDPRWTFPGHANVSFDPITINDQGIVWAQAGDPDQPGRLWLGRLDLRQAPGQGWTWYPGALLQRAGFEGAVAIATDGDTLWLGGTDALVRIEPARLPSLAENWLPLIRGIRLPGQGSWSPATGKLRLNYSREPLTISYAAPRYTLGGTVLYQQRLAGFDDQWSEWSTMPETTFTNLEGGPFTFEVRAQDATGRISGPASFTFSVSPPWFRSDIAFVAYTLLAFGSVVGLVRWRLRNTERERLRLERVVAERTAELKIAKDAADEANRAKSTFLANMSHELRTPLNGVIGYAQVLIKDHDLSPKNRERLRIVQTSGEHLLRMINEVLDFSKIEAGKMELATMPFHLPQLLRDIAAAASPRFEQKQIEFVFDPAGDLPDLVIGDPLKLRQIIDNLLSNAAKFTPGGTVRLQVLVVGPEVMEFSVSDTGIGITERDLAHLFTPFQQAVDGRPPEPGTGLGLAISRRLVEMMDGRLEVESHPGSGSRFFFSVRLPVLAADAEARHSTASLITGYHGRRRRILIVDDIATNRHVLRDMLEPLGFEITGAANGAEALAFARDLPPDAVFLDLRMPGIDGLELARRLRERAGGDKMKLIAMSASVMSFNRERAMEAGCDDFLSKPFREDDLLARLGLALHLEWVGGGRPAGGNGSRSPFDEIRTELPTRTLAELLAIARRGEVALLRRRLSELAGDPLADALDAIAKTYRMERLREMLEQQLAKAPPA